MLLSTVLFWIGALGLPSSDNDNESHGNPHQSHPGGILGVRNGVTTALDDFNIAKQANNVVSGVARLHSIATVAAAKATAAADREADKHPAAKDGPATSEEADDPQGGKGNKNPNKSQIPNENDQVTPIAKADEPEVPNTPGGGIVADSKKPPPLRQRQLGVAILTITAGAIRVVSMVRRLWQLWNMLGDDEGEAPPVVAAFRFHIAHDRNEIAPAAPISAGGHKPDIRIYGATGNYLGKWWNEDDKTCIAGDSICDVAVEPLDGKTESPDYALISANDNSICVTLIGITYFDDTKYMLTIGNWAKSCNRNFGNQAASWFYTNDVYPTASNGTISTACAWLDGNGDQPTTGISVHWPEFDGNQVRQADYNASAYCNNGPALKFHTECDPQRLTLIDFRPQNQDEWEGPDANATAPLPATPGPNSRPGPPPDKRGNTMIDDTEGAKYNGCTGRNKRSSAGNVHKNHLVKSTQADHSAVELCNSTGSRGPSFVSHHERRFCDMQTKTVYEFCEDLAGGMCWDEGQHRVTMKTADGHVTRAETIVDLVPAMNFEHVKVWDVPRIIGA